MTAVSESYDATFAAAVSDPEVFEANDSLTIDSYVPGVSADVHPLAFDAPNPLVVGQSFTLAGNAANAGTTTMQGVTATIDLRAPLRLDGATWGASKTPCTISGLRATCAIGTLFGHSSVPVAVSATPTAQAASTTATVTVTSTTPEQQPDPLPDTVTLTRPVKPPIADLGVAVNLPSTQPIVDAPTPASIVVTNHGTAGARTSSSPSRPRPAKTSPSAPAPPASGPARSRDRRSRAAWATSATSHRSPRARASRSTSP